MYDIAIIGAGPSGANLARLIGKRFKVLLVDKRQIKESPEPELTRKCCGGLLAPDAQGMLSKFGLGLPKNILVDPQLFVVRAIDLQSNIERFYQRYYINMYRNRFDHWLLTLVPSCVDVKLGFQFISFEKEKNIYKIYMKKDGKPYVERAKVLVGADGSLSLVRKQVLSGSPMPRRYLAVQEWVRCRKKLPYFTALFDNTLSDYYCWTIPKGDNLVIGAALEPKKDVIKKFALLKDKLKNYGYAFDETVFREGTYILKPIGLRTLSCGTKGVALIGEAGGWISPSSAEGISYAFKTAFALAEALLEDIDGFEIRYHNKTGPLRRNIFLKNLKSCFIFHPRLRKAAMLSNLNSLDVYEEELNRNCERRDNEDDQDHAVP